MAFLKQIRAHGFKSFADPTILDFSHDMIGVVGPNGSGKSNITDAIRWALGEQSAKSLRGSNLDDVVFSGSSDRPALDFAEVTLVFDNSNRVFSTIDEDVVEITRKFNKKTRDSDFFINNERVKMRDIQDAALETGLTKSSIAIISQGTISTFAEAKAEARREIFDEAAGVAKYKKRKREATAKLIKTVENLNRVEDLMNEIARRLPNLERQSNKALAYKSKIEELQKYEVAILTRDVKIFKNKIDQLSIQKSALTEKVKILSNDINFSEKEFSEMINETSTSEISMFELNDKFNELVQRISELKVKKNDAESRENNQNKNDHADEIKAKQYKKEFDEKNINVQIEKEKQQQWNNRLTEVKEKYDYLSDKFENLYAEVNSIRENAWRLKMQKENLEKQQHSSNFSNANYGSQAIINHAKTIGGVIGTLMSLVQVQEKHQVAISVAAAASMHSVVMKTSDDVKRAVEFLKRNQAGRVTFLPLNTLNPSTIQGPQRTAIQQQPGFIGFANDIVTIDEQYRAALDYALGTIIVVDNYDSAIMLAKNINYRFNIVTLEGERILPHGAIVGGKTKNQNIFAQTQQSENNLEEISEKLQQFEQLELDKNQQLNDVKNDRDKTRDEINTLSSTIRVSIDAYNQMINQLRSISEDYKIITGKSLDPNDNTKSNELESIKFAKEIAKLELERDNAQLEINALSANKNKYADRQKELNEQNSVKRQELSDLKDQLSKVSAELEVLHVRNIESLKRLTEGYGITSDTALEMEEVQFENEEEVRDRIIQLTNDLRDLGNVNLDAIVEYQQEKERHDYYLVQTKEIREAVEKLESIIHDIDIAMETQFKKVIDDVNEALPEAFRRLFGGGTAKLIYTDPENILETGIDIQVSPPGKKISNLNLLSGGEKSLVALSVLFSILKARPLPLVILDEAEAPLDPANVERFARYIKHFTNHTQFIVVTHREGTMENVDILFGVTMETKGITKIVKIKLIDAKKMVAEESPTT
ncbi:chromosome condensation and segregation SMC ATPase [Williamsoniiplasma luminosum]|uniref:Chromosome partition protein Smc n=1 Tax=Williamsoniiplasma luminosum TaxID=214888 RepID=A0A2K8NTH5_9MOLU|nr:AAA family ATPase [Williamsoniiplasma luminosum]ATZ17089.1 chromosome condensation and segregation SMC ATPase [Williamsoniiplasma luminosum]